MKFTVKHGLITCLALAVAAMLLPWMTFGAGVFSGLGFELTMNGVGIGGLWTWALTWIGDLVKLITASGYVTGVAQFKIWAIALAIFVLPTAAFVMTITSLMMAIFSKSKKSSVAMLVMQSCTSLIALAEIVCLVCLENNINDVSVFRIGAGSIVYFVASLGAVIVSVMIVKRFVEQQSTAVKGDPSQCGVLCLAGEYLGVSIPLDSATTLTIGRDASVCSLVLSGGKISRKHCEISYDAAREKYRVVDFSTNGTFVKDGPRLEKERPTELMPGTVLYLGNEMNTFRLQ